MKHYELSSFEVEYLQARNVAIEDWQNPFTPSVVYYHLKQNFSKDNFDDLFESLGGRFIVDSDFNAKYPQRKRRITTTKGRSLFKSMNSDKLNYLSSNAPIYWSTNPNELPIPLNLFIIKNIFPSYTKISFSPKFSSDHTPVITAIN